MTGHYIIEMLVYVRREKDGWLDACVFVPFLTFVLFKNGEADVWKRRAYVKKPFLGSQFFVRIPIHIDDKYPGY